MASGLSGYGRFSNGGNRDFINGVRYVDGVGDLNRGGGKVVKNVAGFDFPKLMVGSLGRLGILTEVSFKVFPEPEEYSTVTFACASFNEALQKLVNLLRRNLVLEAVEWVPPGTLAVRMGGISGSLAARLERLRAFMAVDSATLDLAEEPDFWTRQLDFAWSAPEQALIKIPTSPVRV